MWEVYEHRDVEKQIRSSPDDIIKRYEKWKDIVSLSGPDGLKLIKGFRDEILKGNWKGHRSSRLNYKYRVIYMIENEKTLIKVMSITSHDNRRKKLKNL